MMNGFGKGIPRRVLYMNLGTTRSRGRPRNRWKDEVKEDGRIVGGEEWQKKVHNREEWKKLLRTARNRHILHMPMEQNRIAVNFIVLQCFLIIMCMLSVTTHVCSNPSTYTSIWAFIASGNRFTFPCDSSLYGDFLTIHYDHWLLQ